LNVVRGSRVNNSGWIIRVIKAPPLLHPKEKSTKWIGPDYFPTLFWDDYLFVHNSAGSWEGPSALTPFSGTKRRSAYPRPSVVTCDIYVYRWREVSELPLKSITGFAPLVPCY
jgi:hypothetical protein